MADSQKCPLCPRSNRTFDRPALFRHFTQAHPSLKYQCYLCQRSFNDLNILYLHLRHHGATNPDKSSIKLVKTNSVHSKVLGYLDGREYIDEDLEDETPAATANNSRIDQVKVMSDMVKGTPSLSGLQQPDKFVSEQSNSCSDRGKFPHVRSFEKEVDCVVLVFALEAPLHSQNTQISYHLTSFIEREYS